ncbi:MAG: alpha/beta fold hydrolase [Candidatus Dormiibacterota bacterium]
MNRPKLDLAIGLGLTVCGYAALVGWARRAAVSDPPMAEMESALNRRLDQAGLAASHRYVHTPAGRVHLLVGGTGESTLLFVPGLGASAGDFPELLAQLARRHRVVAVDLPGSGLSDPVAFKGHPGRAWNQVISAVTEQLGIGEFDLVGHSLGGLAVGGFAISHPERPRRLVLLSPFGLSRRIPLHWNLALVPGSMDLLAFSRRLALARSAGSESARGDDRYLELVGTRFGSGSDFNLVARMLRLLRLRAESELAPALGLLSGRALVIWGSEDGQLPLPDAARQLSYYPGIQLEILPGAGHLFPATQPESTARLITAFLAG